MKKIFYFVVTLLGSIVALADPAWPDSILVNQPDSTNLWVYDRGDEFYNWVESTDGYVIVRNDKGIFEYATTVNNKLQPSGIKVHNVKEKGL